MLKYPVYIRSVTNLSDARYCAGMGVEMIGFCFDKQNPDYIEPTIALGLMGWLSGVKFVAEFDNNTTEEINQIIAEIKPDFISIKKTEHFQDWGIPIIFRLNLVEGLKFYPPQGAYILVENSSQDLNQYNLLNKEFTDMYKLILSTGFTKENIDIINDTYQPYGFSLKGGTEISPGLKNYDDLAEILEALEV